ncbi:MAG: hypothetical protein QNJ13_10895 [Paracoccaceae bacterium]|nr:hypothetical protein [Paracoccaceae bacterium]
MSPSDPALSRRALLLTAGAALLVPARARAGGAGAEAPLPARAVYRDVIGPAAEIAMIRSYRPPEAGAGTLRVTDRAGLAEAVRRADPGTVVSCAPGDYGGDGTFVREIGGPPVRLVSEEKEGARLSGTVRLEGRSMAFEGWRFGKLHLVRTRNVAICHARMREFQLLGARDTLFEDFVCDGEYRTANKIYDARGGGGTPSEGIVMRRGIICRGSGGNNDLVQTAGSNDFTFEYVTFFDQRHPAGSGFHSDIFQCFNPRDGAGRQRWRFYRCHFYSFDLPEIRTNQGLFLSDGIYRGVDIEDCLFGANNGTSYMGPSVRHAQGAIRGSTSFGGLRGMGRNGELVLRSNFTTALVGEGYSENSRHNIAARHGAFYIARPAHGLLPGYDWRDFVPVRDHGVGASAFLSLLGRVWG